MAIKLSRRQVKEADRVGGIELMVPYEPSPQLANLAEGETRDAVPFERSMADMLLFQSCQDNGLVLVRVAVTRTRTPHTLAGLPGANLVYALAVVIIGRRWVHATGNPQPKVMWAPWTAQ